MHQPFFFILSDHRRESGSEPPLVKSKMESIFSKLPAETRWQAMIDGANHFTFSDQMFTKSPVMIMALQTIGVMGRLEKRRGVTIAGDCVHTFFDVYLKGASTSQLKALPSRYPEVHADFTRAFLKKEKLPLIPQQSARSARRLRRIGPSLQNNIVILRAFFTQGRHGWTLRLRDSINLSVHLSEAAVKPYPTPVSTLRPRNLLPE